MWEPQPPATLRASTACTGITLPFTFTVSAFGTAANGFHAKQYPGMTGRCAREYVLLASVERLRSRRQQQPSNKGGFDCNVNWFHSLMCSILLKLIKSWLL
jgi:hypothetical protein